MYALRIILSLFFGAAPLSVAFAQGVGCMPAGATSSQSGLAGAPKVDFYGVITSLHTPRMTVVTRYGQVLDVDLSDAIQAQSMVTIRLRMPVFVLAVRGPDGSLRAQVVGRAKATAGAWGTDCL